jgi:chemotaxis protein methyltransferase CheR
LQHRVRELGLADFAAYRVYLQSHAEEWAHLDHLCRIPISRFYRDRRVFDHLARVVLPDLAEAARSSGSTTLWCWSAGCASGEEPYSLNLAWTYQARARSPEVALRVVATDTDRHLLERAERACYAASSLKELPADWVGLAFSREGALFSLHPELRSSVDFRCQDIRVERPTERFHLLLCRNLAFTYFEGTLQGEVLEALHERLFPGGVLVVGSHESLPGGAAGFSLAEARLGVYVRR